MHKRLLYKHTCIHLYVYAGVYVYVYVYGCLRLLPTIQLAMVRTVVCRLTALNKLKTKRKRMHWTRQMQSCLSTFKVMAQTAATFATDCTAVTVFHSTRGCSLVVGTPLSIYGIRNTSWSSPPSYKGSILRPHNAQSSVLRQPPRHTTPF